MLQGASCVVALLRTVLNRKNGRAVHRAKGSQEGPIDSEALQGLRSKTTDPCCLKEIPRRFYLPNPRTMAS